MLSHIYEANNLFETILILKLVATISLDFNALHISPFLPKICQIANMDSIAILRADVLKAE